MQFQIASSCVHRCADIIIYDNYGYTTRSACLSYIVRMLTFPIQTMEIYYQMNNKIVYTFSYIYKGFIAYNVCNFVAYVTWFKSMKFLDKHINCKNKQLKIFIVGFLSGISTDITTNPIKVIKSNLQNRSFCKSDIFIFSNYLYRGLLLRFVLSGVQNVIFCFSLMQ